MAASLLNCKLSATSGVRAREKVDNKLHTSYISSYCLCRLTVSNRYGEVGPSARRKPRT